MAKAVAPGLYLLPICILFFLPSGVGTSLKAGTHYLRCDFSIKSHPTDREEGWEVHCTADGVTLLHHSSGGKVVNDAKTCGGLYPKLKDTGEDLRKQLLHMEKEAVLTRGHHAMEGTMVSQYKQGQRIDASWNFTIDGQHSFCYVHYNQNNKKWEVINYNATGILDNWENNAELAQDLAMLSMGDSRHCLEEFLKHQKEMPRPTSRTPNIREIASATQHPCAMNTTQLPPIRQLRDNRESMAVAIPIILFVIAIVVAIVIGSGIGIGICTFKYLKKKCHPQEGERLNSTSFTQVSRIWKNRRGQHTPIVMGEPQPGNNTNIMVMSSLLGASPQCFPKSSSGV